MFLSSVSESTANLTRPACVPGEVVWAWLVLGGKGDPGGFVVRADMLLLGRGNKASMSKEQA